MVPGAFFFSSDASPSASADRDWRHARNGNEIDMRAHRPIPDPKPVAFHPTNERREHAPPFGMLDEIGSLGWQCRFVVPSHG